MNSQLHKPARFPADEALRIEALRSCQILDTTVEAAFDDIALLAAQVCDAPIALVSLVDTDRQWFKAEVGLGARQTPRTVSVCAHAIQQSGVFIVPDTLLDERFMHSPIVHGGPMMRFYAGAPLRTPDGFALGTVCVLDRRPRALNESQHEALVTLARQAMALIALRRSYRDAEAIQKDLRRLMTVAGHDLRQPLQIIGMALEFARMQSSDPKLLKHLDVGLEATYKLGHDLDSLAIASSALAQVFVPRCVVVSVRDQFEALEKSWTPAAEAKRLHLRFVRSSLEVVTDPKLLNTVLGNLIGNAIKYTDRGKIVVGCRRTASNVIIQVLDSGIGIEPERQQEVFEAFSKVDTRSPGLGLGLSIVRNAMDLLGHRLHLSSVVDRGTSVKVEIPRAPGKESRE